MDTQKLPSGDPEDSGQTRPLDTLWPDRTGAGETGGDQTPTRETRIDETTAFAEHPSTPGPVTGTSPVPPLPPLPPRPRGPHAPAIVLGIVCLAVAAVVLAQELGHLSVDWGDVGPLGIIVTGAVLVLLGLVGLLSSRRKAT